jgi:hypothetical protein
MKWLNGYKKFFFSLSIFHSSIQGFPINIEQWVKKLIPGLEVFVGPD